jgi:ketosteroid isomerase-like protein
MPQQNVEVQNEAVRRFFWAFEYDSEAFRDSLHPEIEWFPIDENRTRVSGVEDAVRNRNQWLESWDGHRFDLEEVVEKGDSVVVLVHITARGKASGIEVDVRFYAQFTVRDGKVVYIFDHHERAAALEAAGLNDKRA